MQRLTRLTRLTPTLLISITVATFTLAGCGGDTSTEPADRSATTSASPDEPAEGSDANDDPEATNSASEPTGRLILDGETWDLTYDADDPNAQCKVIAGSVGVVSGMRTPDGNRVDLSVQTVPSDYAMATYFDDKEVPLRAIETDVSSEAPEWSVDGSTIRVSGLWVHRHDPSQPEVEGELEVTC
ncbi:MAG: hypothetical protein WBA45_01690 [Microthrixaceae bacterium]